jgi:phage baseplate assembly protein W
MPSIFDTPLTGYRYVQTQYGDTLQTFAARVMGDASNWSVLIGLNGLMPPYLTDDPDSAGAGVVLNGSFLMIPAATPSTSLSADDVFKTDVLLDDDGFFAITENGDLATVSGVANLKQALENALDTDQGELLYHPEYGYLGRRLLGQKNGPTAGMLAARYAKQTVSADSRIAKVDDSTAKVVGDAINAIVQAETIAGTKVPINTTVSNNSTSS